MKPKTTLIVTTIVVCFAISVIGLAAVTMTNKWEKAEKAHDATKEQLKICQTNLATFKNLDEKNISDIETYILGNYRRVPPIVAKEISIRTVELASKYGLPVPILVGMMEVESNFSPHAQSKKNARGLMQVRWSVWEKTLKEKLGLTEYHQLHQINNGITAGIIVFKHYMDINDNNISKALYAYVGKDDSYATKVYSAMGRFVLHRGSTMPQVEEPNDNAAGDPPQL